VSKKSEDVMATDNRMAWIRNLETLAGGCEDYRVEFELGSECRIAGLLDYGNGRIICAPMSTGESGDGLWLYNLVLRFPLGPESWTTKADEKGYYFKDGVAGELAALMSVFFRCRFYLISSRLSLENPRLGMTLKREHPFIRFKCNPALHAPIFQNGRGNFAEGFKHFLDQVKTLNDDLHQKFILSCAHYARGLREVGVDSEMVFIRLVSSIEALSMDMVLTHRDDVLESRGIESLISESRLSDDQKRELQAIFDVRKSRKKFVRFIEQHCGEFFKGGNFRAKRLKITRKNLGKVLNTIYSARSAYLHSGEPMFLSMPIKGGEHWDTDPSVGTIIDRRHLKGSRKLPYAHFFEGLVRQCLMNYLKVGSSEQASRVMSESVFAYGSNMCSGRFRDYGVTPENDGKKALLPGFRLVFNKKSTDGSGKANLESREGSNVWGVVYCISKADLRRLDNGEVGYQRAQMDVKLSDDSAISVWVYLAIAPSHEVGLRPYTWYKRFLVEGGREHSLPATYVTELEGIDAVQDGKAERDRTKRSLKCGTTE
jgi:gamma-glutamylcyclotransferase